MNWGRRRAALRQTATNKDRRACDGKMKYPSRKNASASARAAERMFRNGPMNAYRCPLCRRWHIGHDRFARSA